ncbi:AAA family ATPase [Kibdelosporangium philippinense]|uniref:AAA family ATPase n=1 Tax=Kibdelosporangium philippinense TaxID=211113 RepID=A0ABS8ZKH3_9PSEU|nr:BTAD domain-containing putative transcriptional regulator [Kibdelosporangium philippinense]MCE7008057.1 AAA family ATPase [Kibdelosporangium philippinense]
MGSEVRFGVLGPLVASDSAGPIDLKGPRHRAVLARLIIARGRVVPVDMLVNDLWDDPPEGAVGAIQTFIAALRKALEPDRPPRTPARLLVTSGPGYALRAEHVDAWEFEATLDVDLWRGPAYVEFADQPWARAEVARLDELRLLAIERRAEGLLELGRAAETVPSLRAHVDDHPWRENAWRLLALAQYQAGRQGDALDSLRRARQLLKNELGLDPGPALAQLEADVLAQARPDTPVLIGRSRELDQLAEAAANVATTGRLGLALVSGEAGAGKTALAKAFRVRLDWPSRWSAYIEDAPSGFLEPVEVSDPATARFQRYRAVRTQLAAFGRQLIVLDDLHWADAETLSLLASVIADPVDAPVLIVGTYRTTDAPTAFLGRVARSEPTRIYLGGLSASDIPAVVQALDVDVDFETAEVIHRRSGGNPFYIRELARLVAAGSDLSGVPVGVLDVVRYRLSRLPTDVQSVLRKASVVGEEFTLDIVGNLDAVEVAVQQGFLVELEAGEFRFSHSLVRDTLYQDLSRSRRSQLHLEVGATLEQVRPDPAALAHHFSLASDPRAAGYARDAAIAAEKRFDFGEAVRLWRIAMAADDRLESIMGLIRALSFTGALGQARELRSSALDLLDPGDDPEQAARVIASFDVPAIWTTPDDPALAARVVEVTERVLPSVTSASRSRLLAMIAMELRSSGGPRAVRAAAEAVEIARSLDDPSVLAFALNAQFMQSFQRAGRAPERVRIGAELVDVATRHSLVTFEVLGHMILMQGHSALASFADADVHADAVTRLGRDYQLPLAEVFVQWYRALRTSVAGGDAMPLYRAAFLGGTEMPGLGDGILSFALLCHQVRNGLAVSPDMDFGVYAPWCRPGEVIPPSPHDLLFEARTCLHAIAAIKAGDWAAMEELYEVLLPASGELAGASSGLLTLQPVAHYLAKLARGLGRHRAAARHDAEAKSLVSG